MKTSPKTSAVKKDDGKVSSVIAYIILAITAACIFGACGFGLNEMINENYGSVANFVDKAIDASGHKDFVARMKNAAFDYQLTKMRKDSDAERLKDGKILSNSEYNELVFNRSVGGIVTQHTSYSIGDVYEVDPNRSSPKGYYVIGSDDLIPATSPTRGAKYIAVVPFGIYPIGTKSTPPLVTSKKNK